MTKQCTDRPDINEYLPMLIDVLRCIHSGYAVNSISGETEPLTIDGARRLAGLALVHVGDL